MCAEYTDIFGKGRKFFQKIEKRMKCGERRRQEDSKERRMKKCEGKKKRNDEQQEDEARRHFLERSFEGWKKEADEDWKKS